MKYLSYFYFYTFLRLSIFYVFKKYRRRMEEKTHFFVELRALRQPYQGLKKYKYVE